MRPPLDLRTPDSLGTFDRRFTPCLRTDVLVLGAGIAGCAAALQAADAGASVLLLTKTPFTDTNSAWAQGGVAAVLNSADSVDLHLEDTLRVGAGLADPTIARSIISESAEVVSWLVSLGVELDRGDGGEFLFSREGGHSVNRVVHHGDATGGEIQRAIEAAVTSHPSITCKPGAFVRDLLMNDGCCTGAVALVDDMELAVEAGAVLVAAGGAGQLYRETTNPIGASGDGVALCFRAGARVADIEFVQFHPTTLYIAGASRFLISEVVRGAGAVLRDRDGAAFMAGVHPSADLAPRDVVSRAILARMVATRDTHVYLDLSAVEDPHRSFPTISRMCRGFDIDIEHDAIPVRPGAHYMIGGVVSDEHGATDVPGLFVAGESAATGFHGANRLASNSLLEGAVQGQRAGARAARFARETRPGLPDRIEEPGVGVDAPRIHLDDMLYSLKSLMWHNVGLNRDQRGLEEAIQRIAMWSHYLRKANPRSRQGYELYNMLTVSGLVASAGRHRTESRGTHYRADYSHRDDDRWCRRIFLRRADDGTVDTTTGAPQGPTDQVPA